MIRTAMLERLPVPVLAAICLSPAMPSAAALLLGICVALTLGNPYQEQTRKLTHHLLALSVIGLGAGMDLHVIGQVGMHGVGITAISITLVLVLGLALGTCLRVPRHAALLIAVGTAICGGSAIAAVAPVLRARHHDISVALGVVFLLNALALVIFPAIGHALHLTEAQFGLWSALAIHDTSSVVGATAQYGAQALEIGTTVKLTRALWIVPIACIIGMVFRPKEPDGGQRKAGKPWFILGFIAAAALVTYVPAVQPAGHAIATVAKHILVMTLFFIGASLTRATVRAVGFRPFVQGALLWLLTLSINLMLVMENII